MNINEIFAFNAPYNKDNIEELINKISKNKIVPFIGAGMSMLFEGIYPSWNEFLKNTYKKYICFDDTNSFDELNYEDKADFLYEKIGKVSFSDHMKRIFSDKHLNIDASEYQDKAVYMLPLIFEKGLIVTTNYDKVIEKVYTIHQKNITVAHPGHFEALNNALRNDELLLYKIHGDISEPTDSIILTRSQYNEAYKDDKLIDALKNIFISKDMLFLGCSLISDRYLENMSEVIGSGMNNFAILPCTKTNINNRRVELENKYNIRSILYPEGKHECVYDILEYIVNRLNSYNNIEQSIKFDDEWFVKQNKVQIQNLGDRYLPELNIEVSLNHVFDALSRNDNFYRLFADKTDNVLSKLNKLELECIKDYINDISNIVEVFLSEKEYKKMNISAMQFNVQKIFKALDGKRKEYYDILSKENGDKLIEQKLYNLNMAYKTLSEYDKYIDSAEVQVLNNSFVIVHGEGGTGKSHLLADVINQRILQGKKSLFFLGQHFKSTDPYTEMLRLLGLSCDFGYLLKQLNSIGEKEKSQIIIFIDALNLLRIVNSKI